MTDPRYFLRPLKGLLGVEIDPAEKSFWSGLDAEKKRVTFCGPMRGLTGREARQMLKPRQSKRFWQKVQDTGG